MPRPIHALPRGDNYDTRDPGRIIEWTRLGTQIAIVVAVMLLDRTASGRLHPVYAMVLVGVVALYATVNGVGHLPAVEQFAAGLTVNAGT